MTLPASTQTIFDTAINDVFQTFEQSITYNSSTITAMITFPSEQEIQNNLINYDAICTVKKSDVTLPVAGDVIIWETVSYRVGQPKDNAPAWWDLEIYKV